MKSFWYEHRNLSLLMDFYELTMSNCYFMNGFAQKEVTFDLFYRNNPDNGGFVIFAGLEQAIDIIQNLKFQSDDIDYLRGLDCFDEAFLEYLANFTFRGTIYAVEEGMPVYPHEPLVRVMAPLIDAQLIETILLTTLNHQSMIATKANRIVRAAEGRTIMDFGARRAHSYDAAHFGARACYIGGVDITATVSAGKEFDIPLSGTMAHSFIQLFGNSKESEYQAFLSYAKVYPDSCSLLIDTYDVLNSGLPNAIRLAKEVLEPQGNRLKSVRIDSGDLAYLSKSIRKELNRNGLEDCKIVVSNSVDEYLITSLILQGAKIDSFGVGERMITSKSNPVFGGVYKMAAVKENGNWVPRIKKSENIEKITYPGMKKVYRLFDKQTGFSFTDVILLEEEKMDAMAIRPFVDPKKPWRKIVIDMKEYDVKELLVPIFVDGRCVYEKPTLQQIRALSKEMVNEKMWSEEKRFENPHRHYVNLSPALYQLQMQLLNECGDD